MTFWCGETRVRLGFSFFFVLAVFFYADRSGAGLWMLAAALWHELGHLLVMAAFSVPVERMELGAFGMRITPKGELLRPGLAPAVYAAGPAFNLVMAALLWSLSGGGYSLLLGSACQTAMGLFNLLPIRGLDGGNLLSCLLSPLGEERARGLLGAASAACLVPLLAAGGWLLLSGGGNVTLLVTASYLAVMALLR